MTITICDDDKKICSLFAKKIGALYPKARISCLYDGGSLLNMADAPDILLLDIQIKQTFPASCALSDSRGMDAGSGDSLFCRAFCHV